MLELPKHHCFHFVRVDNPDAASVSLFRSEVLRCLQTARKLTTRFGIANNFVVYVQIILIARLLCNLLLELDSLLLGKALEVFLDHNKVLSDRINLNFRGRVSSLEDFLREYIVKVCNLKKYQILALGTHDSLLAL